MTLDEYNSFKRQIDSLRQKADRLEGSEHQLKEQLRKDHGCGSLKEAKTLLKKLEEKEARFRQEAEKEKKAFEKKWGELLS